ELTQGKDASVSVMTYSLHYGLGAFEGIRAYEGESRSYVFRLREHLERLLASSRMALLEVPFTVDELLDGCVQTLQANKLQSGYLRPLVFVDDGKRGLGATNNRVRVAIASWAWGAYLGEENLVRGIRARVSSWARMSARSFLPKGKLTGQYINSILAKREALQAGFDEAILLDEGGFVSEASGENIFIVSGGRLITPPRSSPILEGITRDSILQIAQHLGVPAEESAFTRGQLYNADEVFFTGTAAEVTPVREVDGRVIGAGGRGPITERLQTFYFDAVRGRADGFERWLTPYSVS
ncbi:MAG: branched-chain amino acid transaminase, partial [Myxococcota bacterium]